MVLWPEASNNGNCFRRRAFNSSHLPTLLNNNAIQPKADANKLSFLVCLSTFFIRHIDQTWLEFEFFSVFLHETNLFNFQFLSTIRIDFFFRLNGWQQANKFELECYKFFPITLFTLTTPKNLCVHKREFEKLWKI